MLRIYAPIGGFGNHVRWLTLLDEQYKFEFLPRGVSHTLYHTHKTNQWPEYLKFTNPKYPLTEFDPEILEEIIATLNIPYLNFVDQKNKIESIEKYVYPEERSWHNWLQYEWLFRDFLNSYLYFNHWINDVANTDQTLILVSSPELALRCYLKFNNNLNNSSIENFLLSVQKYTDQHNTLPLLRKNIKIESSDVLFQPTLDRNFYNTLITWFGLSDNYDLANQIHNMWYNGHIRAEKEFVKNITTIYNKYE